LRGCRLAGLRHGQVGRDLIQAASQPERTEPPAHRYRAVAPPKRVAAPPRRNEFAVIHDERVDEPVQPWPVAHERKALPARHGRDAQQNGSQDRRRIRPDLTPGANGDGVRKTSEAARVL
jgi:hypothetical protein